MVYATGGKLRGGNSAFAFIGSYSGDGDGITVKISTERHNADPSFRPLFGTDMITLTLKGRQDGDVVDFKGNALQLPAIAFHAMLTRISDQRGRRDGANCGIGTLAFRQLRHHVDEPVVAGEPLVLFLDELALHDRLGCGRLRLRRRLQHLVIAVEPPLGTVLDVLA